MVQQQQPVVVLILKVLWPALEAWALEQALRK
jgi:hypothetical protein